MRARGVAVAVAALVVVAVAAIVVVAVRAGPPPSRAAQAEAIAAELRCPTCQALSVADSRSEPAGEIRRQIDALLAQGYSADEVKRHFVDRYGGWILLAPSSPVAWLAPALVIAAAVAGLAIWLRRQRPASLDSAPSGAPAVPATERHRDRVREELEALDA